MSKRNPKRRVHLRSVRPPADPKTILILIVSGSVVLAITLLAYLYGAPLIADHQGSDTALIKVLQFLMAFVTVAAFFGVAAVLLGLIKLVSRLLRRDEITLRKR